MAVPTRDPKVEQAITQAKALEQEPETAPQLEEYLKQQIAKETYDLEANLALLKLYQFYPSLTDVDVLQKLLLKALLDMPSTAFLLSSFLIPERFAERKEVLSVQHLHSLLEGCRFKEFWEAEELKEVRTSTPIPGLEASARNFGYGVLSSSHQKCSEALASEVLDLSGNSLKAFLKTKGTDVIDGSVSFTESEFNQKRAHEAQSSVQVGQVLRIF